MGWLGFGNICSIGKYLYALWEIIRDNLIVDLQKFREEKNPYITEEDVWNSLINLSDSEMMIITKSDGKLRVAKVRVSRFEIDPQSLVESTK